MSGSWPRGQPRQPRRPLRLLLVLLVLPLPPGLLLPLPLGGNQRQLRRSLLPLTAQATTGGATTWPAQAISLLPPPLGLAPLPPKSPPSASRRGAGSRPRPSCLSPIYSERRGGSSGSCSSKRGEGQESLLAPRLPLQHRLQPQIDSVTPPTASRIWEKVSSRYNAWPQGALCSVPVLPRGGLNQQPSPPQSRSGGGRF